MTDLRLFEPEPVGRARRNDPETSKRAARRQDGSLKARVEHAFEFWGPMSDDRMCERLDLPVRRWPSAKTARSALAHCDPPILVSTGTEDENGLTIWRHRNWYPKTADVDTGGRV